MKVISAADFEDVLGMELTYDPGIVEVIAERAGEPDGEEPRVVGVFKYEGFPLGKDLYAVVFEGEPEPIAADLVWAAE
jgi:hypothetical protein